MEIELKNIKNELFSNVNLNIKENEITSIIGKNSSGKTFLLDILYGLNFKYDGTIIVNNKELNNKTKINIRNDIFYLMDDFEKLLFSINIYEDIKYVVDKIDNQKLDELLKQFGLDKTILDKSYLEISISEKKKILLVIAFLSDKKILLLDNPTLYLDYKSKQNLIKLLKRKRLETIILIASMDTDFLLNISDKVIAINNNKLILYSNKYEIFENKTLLNKIGVKQPNICDFIYEVKSRKNIKLPHRDNINDLLKDVYRNAK